MFQTLILPSPRLNNNDLTKTDIMGMSSIQ
jgi:hypothetical protein